VSSALTDPPNDARGSEPLFRRVARSLRAEMAGRPLKVQRAVEAAIQITDAIADCG